MSYTIQDFIEYHATLKGDEKSEAQTFLDRFFRAFGHEGATDAGAVYEQRVKKGSAKGKTGFADLVWKRPETDGKGGVLIEMKSRKEDLNKHTSQLFQYWWNLVPDRPRYAMLCNFDEFWIYDFNLQVDTPVDVIAIAQLLQRQNAFRFMTKAISKTPPIFGNNQIPVTTSAASQLGVLYGLLKDRSRKDGFDELTAQKFVLQCVLAMFAEDRGLLPEEKFLECIDSCLNGESTYDVIGGLFQEMNRKGITQSGRYKGVDYFNGGLFADIYPIELTEFELQKLRAVAIEDWSKVRPAIFGSIFESTSDEKERHARGMHFTSEVDIMKIVYPTITKYWGEKIEAANTIAELNTLQLELQGYRVLDPACGSGNFLYMAYQELKQVEVDLLNKIASKQKSSQIQMGLVTPNQFFGMDINPFAVELARVTLTIARKVAIDKHGLSEPALPLDTLDRNIVCQDALFTDWVEADAIIGNPPFLGGKRIRSYLGNDYIERIFAKFPDVKDSVDFCSYWFRIAHDNLNENGRAGLVGTNSISQGKSRVASIDYIVQNGGYIHDAISTQEWSGEAAVHVSIANWSKQPAIICRLDNKIVSRINSSFQAEIDVSQAAKLKSNANLCFTGVTPIGKAFVISLEQAEAWKNANPKNQEIIRPFLEGNDLVGNPYVGLNNWIIDFNDMSIEDASEYVEPFAWVRSQVKPERDLNRRQIYQKYWWQLGERRPAMREALKNLSQYFAVPQTSKWAIFLPCSSEWLPNARTRIVASEDFYVLGILTSRLHRIWMEAQMSTLEDRISYTHNSCFETFPFPQLNIKDKGLKPLVQQIRSTMQELHQYRTEQMEKKQWGITKLYNEYFHEPASQLYNLHAKLDKQVMQLYDFSEDDDLLEKLLHLNQAIA